MPDIKKCRVCGNEFGAESMLKLPGMPRAAQNLPSEKNEAIASGVELDVRQCSFCGLVQLANDPVSYYKDVIRPGGVSGSMRARQLNQLKIFIERFSLSKKNILEIGSGCGEYLSILSELPVNAFGMEHNAEFVKTGYEKGLKIFQAYPLDLREPPDGVMFDAFISINVLEHAPNPVAFLRSSANFLTESGVGMISVPDFEFELNDNYLFSFMSDHLSYFSQSTLYNTLAISGFDVVEIYKSKELNVITAYVKKRRQCDLAPVQEKNKKFNERINHYIKTIQAEGGRIAIWGASHLAFSIISSAKIVNKIEYIIDSSPCKQGRFSPASGLEIFPPEHLRKNPVNTILIMCPEYSTEIGAVIEKQYSDLIEHIATFINGDLKAVK